MAARTYENFDLVVEGGEDGAYRARVTSSPTGDVADARFSLPFDGTRLENLLLRLDPGRSGVRRGAADPRVDAGRQLGEGLFESLFAGDVAVAWARARDSAHAEGKGLRLRLRLDDAPGLACLPWELLYDRRTATYLAHSERTPVVRYLDVHHLLRPLHVGGALHVLTVISAPTDLPELDVEAEWGRVQEALKDRVAAGTVLLERLPEATLPALGAWLRRHTVHVLHFVGHGDYDPGLEEGVIHFCDRYGRSQPVTASVLGPYISDHDPLRLVVLNSCRSASTGSDDPFAGMAQGLVRQNSSAVVAMQFPITDRAAVAFTGEFYGALADEYPVDQAVTHARKALFASFGSEWATPTLFMQAADGVVFDDIVAEPPAQVVAAAPGPGPAPEPVPVPVMDQPVPDEVALEQPVPDQPVPDEVVPDHPVPDQPVPDQPVDRGPRGLAGLPAPPEEETDQAPGRRRLVPVLVGGGAALAVAVTAVLWSLGGDDPTPGAEASTTGATTTTPADPSSGAEPSTGGTSPEPSPPAPPPGTLPADPQASLSARFLPDPITVDGARRDWPGMDAVGSEHVITETPHTTKSDASWRLGWTDEALYLYVEVLDGVITQTHEGDPTRLAQGDSIGVVVGPFADHSPTEALHPDDRYVVIGPTEDLRAIAVLHHPDGAAFVPVTDRVEDIGDMRVVRTQDGYVVEAAIPWDVLGVADPRDASTYAMNISFSDAIRSGPDHGGLATLQSNNAKLTDDPAEHRHLWGTVELLGG